MGLEKAIASGKEHRAEYRGAKKYIYACRNHGTCEWCRRTRMFNKMKTEMQSLMDLRFWMFEEDKGE